VELFSSFSPAGKDLKSHAWKEGEKKGEHCTSRESLAFLKLHTSCPYVEQAQGVATHYGRR
jgi:hypothetical protein